MTTAAQTTVRPSHVKTAIKAVLRKTIENQPIPVKAALKNLLLEMRIGRISKGSARDFQSLSNAKDLKVHLGCGPDRRPGWVNVDLDLGRPGRSKADLPAGTIYINHDLRRGLPLAEESCAMIYSSHFFEHLEYPDGLRLMRDCRRALQPGGVFRMALPDFKGTFAAYLAGDRSYFKVVEPVPLPLGMARGSETLADYVNYAAYQFGEHKCIYDEEKAIAALLSAGFRCACAVDFCPDIDVDTAERRRYSFYIEATR